MTARDVAGEPVVVPPADAVEVEHLRTATSRPYAVRYVLADGTRTPWARLPAAE